jgi:hypothetical protein
MLVKADEISIAADKLKVELVEMLESAELDAVLAALYEPRHLRLLMS